MESFLEEFGLSNAEGLALMCLAEALLRVPDDETADKLIAEKISTGHWDEHLGKSDHWLVNAGTWGLMLTGAHREAAGRHQGDASAVSRQPDAAHGRAGRSPGAMQAMVILGRQFVLGRNIDVRDEARRRHGPRNGSATRYSFDMLGEGARTNEDAERYLASYANADRCGRAKPLAGRGRTRRQACP